MIHGFGGVTIRLWVVARWVPLATRVYTRLSVIWSSLLRHDSIASCNARAIAMTDRVIASLANRILDYEADIRDDMDNMANDFSVPSRFLNRKIKSWDIDIRGHDTWRCNNQTCRFNDCRERHWQKTDSWIVSRFHDSKLNIFANIDIDVLL